MCVVIKLYLTLFICLLQCYTATPSPVLQTLFIQIRKQHTVTVCQTKMSNNEQVQAITMAHIKSGVHNMPNENTEEIGLELLNLKCRLRFQSEPFTHMLTTYGSQVNFASFTLCASLCKKHTFTHVRATY